MEQAIYITKLKNLRYWNKKYTRLYYGIEFCERLIPTTKELCKIIRFVIKNKVEFTLVTPYVTESYLKKVNYLLGMTERKIPFSEVMINDWGVLNVLNKKYKKLRPILGRLLNKMKREPRVLNILNKLPNECIDELKTPEITVKSFREILKENNIKRIEFDNVLQGIKNVNIKKYGFKGSLYLPFAYVTTTRLCLANYCGEKNYDYVGIFPCQKECQKFMFKLTHKTIPVPLILKGNTQFFKNKKMPVNLEGIGIDRIVHQPEIPI